MRISKTGATRSSDDNKIDYAHISAVFIRVWCEYMHKHRVQEDGKLRSPDNYKLGLGFNSHRKSLLGHIQDLNLILEGIEVTEKGKKVSPFDAVMGIAFNIIGLVINTMGKTKLERLFTGGKIEEEFNKKFYNKL